MRVEYSPTSLEGPAIFQGFASLGHKLGSMDTNAADTVSPCTQGIKPFYTRDVWILRFWYPEGFLKPIPCTYLRTIVVTQIVYVPINIFIFWSFFGIKNYQCLLCGSEVKNPLAKAGDVVSIPSDPLGEGMATHSIILEGKIPWTEKPGKLQSMGLQRVRHEQSD